MAARTYQEWLDWIEAQPEQAFRCATRTTAVFYSGLDRQNEEFARHDSLVHPDHYCILDTEVGKELETAHLWREELSGLKLEQAQEIAKSASKRYAEASRGDALTHAVDAEPEAIFRETELPALMANEKVESINGISREALRSLSPEQQYQKVCAAELERDKAELTHLNSKSPTSWQEAATEVGKGYKHTNKDQTDSLTQQISAKDERWQERQRAIAQYAQNLQQEMAKANVLKKDHDLERG